MRLTSNTEQQREQDQFNNNYWINQEVDWSKNTTTTTWSILWEFDWCGNL